MASRTSATAVWTGHLTFGMLSVPVKLYSAARNEGTSFNQVHQCKHADGELKGQLNGKVTKTSQQNFCSGCNTVVPYPELSKGFEKATGEYAIVEDAELKALSPGVKSATVEITSFVPLSEVDPIFFDESYFVGVQDAGRKAYETLFQTMSGTKLAGMAKLTMKANSKPHNVFVRTFANGIMLHTIYANAEVRDLPEFNTYRGDITVTANELSVCKQLLETMVETFDRTKLVDDYQVKVEALIESKTTVNAAPGTPTTPKTDDDMMTSLLASLEAAKVAKGTPATEAVAEPKPVVSINTPRKKKVAA